MNIVKKHLAISGQVQGVGFRYFTSREAARRNLNGWVKNLSDGRVEVFVSGDENAVEEMIGRLNEGPSTAVVKDIKELPVNHEMQYNGFTILRS